MLLISILLCTRAKVITIKSPIVCTCNQYTMKFVNLWENLLILSNVVKNRQPNSENSNNVQKLMLLC